MRLIIAGSRDLNPTTKEIGAALYLHRLFPDYIVSGCARGVDTAGEHYADEKKIPILQYPADWDQHGKSAGYKRNELMAKNSDALLAFWDGKSRGTMHMIDIMKKLNKPVYIIKT